MIQRVKLVFIVIISVIATIVAGVNIKQAVERQMDKNSLIEEKTAGKIEIQDIEIERHPKKEEKNDKNTDEVVTTIDEVEADEQGQLAANAGGSGEAEMAETNEEDVYTDMGNEEVPEEEKVDLPEKTTINENDGGSWGFESYTDTDSFELPSEERRQEISDKIDEYGTVLH